MYLLIRYIAGNIPQPIPLSVMPLSAFLFKNNKLLLVHEHFLHFTLLYASDKV
jgi:hypothetical protein